MPDPSQLCLASPPACHRCPQSPWPTWLLRTTHQHVMAHGSQLLVWCIILQAFCLYSRHRCRLKASCPNGSDMLERVPAGLLCFSMYMTPEPEDSEHSAEFGLLSASSIHLHCRCHRHPPLFMQNLLQAIKHVDALAHVSIKLCSGLHADFTTRMWDPRATHSGVASPCITEHC